MKAKIVRVLSIALFLTLTFGGITAEATGIGNEAQSRAAVTAPAPKQKSTASYAVGKVKCHTYLYATASSSSAKLVRLGTGNMIDVLGRSGSYYRAKVAGKTGYVPVNSVNITAGKVPAIAPQSAPVTTQSKAVGKVKSNTYVYATASSSSTKLVRLGTGNMIDVLGRSGSYYKAKAAGKTGYVSVFSVNIVSGKAPAIAPLNAQSTAKRIGIGKARALTYVYASPSTSSRKILSLGTGNNVDIYAVAGSYFKVKAGGKTGYAQGSRIKVVSGNVSTDTKPTTTPTPTPTPSASNPDAAGWYTIVNSQFGIKSNGTSARATTDGINQALTWAKAQGYNKIKFSAGTYLIQCKYNNRYIAPTDGILVPSGMTLDLGTSTFKLEANSYPAYSIISVVSKSNVTIMNGTLIGDLGQHAYPAVSGSSTHEWGFGICISASTGVTVDDVTIKNTTGDGIILEGSFESLADGGRLSSNIKILDCTISNCRRQGISVIGATGSEIARNKIYGISGTDPQYGIDVETEFDYVVDNLKIHHNTIYGCSGGAINCNKGSNYEVYSNTCTGNNIIAVRCSSVKIYSNTINDSFIRVMTYSSNVTVNNNVLDADSWVFFG